MATTTRFGLMARTASLPRRQTARRVCVCSGLLALGLYLASPFVTLAFMAVDLRDHDMAALGQLINWRALDNSIKRQALTGLHLAAAPPADELPEFGSSFASTAVSNAVDTAVTNANLGTLVDMALPEQHERAHQPAPSLAALVGNAAVHFARLDHFTLEVPLPGHERETPLRIDMHIQGWRWKITNVELPVARAPVMQAHAGFSHPA
ncbi:DUF2939 domain-containing protein [Acetobacter vaccinii]|uniref:DUF2939 domain-containing protein n=1 Tax=Acetobacter vaccinii TaxID=2592655 RepID=A0A5C1YNM2_9PROT|nr:DUF2939 domain-containing protein [Acetobacter vaccinii]QEO16677.1 DUF2939 domain-containing protein [Acetobacter vaccinii]